MDRKQMILPPDIQPEWLNVIRRLQRAVFDSGRRPIMVSISVLVDDLGSPRMWTEPRCACVEPSRLASDRLDDIERETLSSD